MMYRCPHCGKLIDTGTHKSQTRTCPNCAKDTQVPAQLAGASTRGRSKKVCNHTARTRRRWLRRLTPLAVFLAACGALVLLWAILANLPGATAVRARAAETDDAATKPFEPATTERYNNSEE